MYINKRLEGLALRAFCYAEIFFKNSKIKFKKYLKEISEFYLQFSGDMILLFQIHIFFICRL